MRFVVIVKIPYCWCTCCLQTVSQYVSLLPTKWELLFSVCYCSYAVQGGTNV